MSEAERSGAGRPLEVALDRTRQWFSLPDPPTSPGGDSLEDVPSIARAHGLAAGRLPLAETDARSAPGPMIAFTRKGQRPILLFPLFGSIWRMEDPASGRPSFRGRALVEGLKSDAWALEVAEPFAGDGDWLHVARRVGGGDLRFALFLAVMAALLYGALVLLARGWSDSLVAGTRVRSVAIAIAFAAAAFAARALEGASLPAIERVGSRMARALFSDLWAGFARTPVWAVRALRPTERFRERLALLERIGEDARRIRAGVQGVLALVILGVLVLGILATGGAGERLALAVAIVLMLRCAAQVLRGAGAVSRTRRTVETRRTGGEPCASEPAAPGRALEIGEIEFRDVMHRYPGRDRAALEGVSFWVAAGEVVGLAGPSGAGKSTALRLVASLEHLETGAIDLDGRPAREATSGLAAVLEGDRLLPGSLAENLCGPTAPPRDALWNVLAVVGLEERIRALPMGLDTPIGEFRGTLSRRERLRLSYGRALLGGPRVLVLDPDVDPFDEPERERFFASLRLHRTTVLLAARHPEELRHVDRILFLVQGRIVEQGRFPDLSRPGTRFHRHFHPSPLS